MAKFTLPVRRLGDVGVITDTDPYNLPITGFTAANNVRFDEGKVTRSAIFRTVSDNLGFTPRGCFGVVPSNGFDKVLLVGDDLTIKEYISGTITDVTGTVTGSTNDNPFTISTLADVLYINRKDHVPVYRTPQATAFADLINWDSTWRCASLRPYQDFLLALNMTEGTSNYPNRVRFSDLVSANTVPGTWDEADTTASAGFNDLVEMQTAIVDGLQLGTKFIIYSQSEAVMMEFVGGAFLFNFRRLFSDEGLINANCAVEAEGKHYCFGNQDIYVHDGNTKQSICDERTKKFIFSGLNNFNADRCFVVHNKALNEIYFCYQSGDALVSMPTTDRCNRAAVYNYRSNCWSFMDLPNVSAGANANVNSIATYATATETYRTIGGSFYDQSDSYNRHCLMVGETDTANNLTSDKLYGLDLADNGSLAFDVDTEATKPPFLERIGLDLDEIQQPIDGYKVITRLLPQLSTNNTDDYTVYFEFGASDIPNNRPNYSTSATFNTNTDYKLDSRAAGRYLSYKITLAADDYKDFAFSGFDVDVTTTGGI